MNRPRKHFPSDKTCERCGATFSAVTHYAITKQRFCSTACNQLSRGKGQFQPLTDVPCAVCGKVMHLLPRQVRAGKQYCSYPCSNAAHNTGEKNAAWKGGTSVYWKQKARERDGFACRFLGCNVTGSRTHAHHKLPRAAGGADSLDNLVTLCPTHHQALELLLLRRLMLAHPEWIQETLTGIYEQTCSPEVAAPVQTRLLPGD